MGTYQKLRVVLLMVIIATTSLQIITINSSHLKFSRQFIRSLHYHILGHDSLDFYWTGQYMINYPINEYFTLLEFDDFLTTFLTFMGKLDQMAFAQLDQSSLNATRQHIYRQPIYGPAESYQWNLSEGFSQPFMQGDIPSLKKSFSEAHSIKIQMEPISFGQHSWHLLAVVEPFSYCSLVVRLYARETVDLANQHILTLLLGLVLLAVLAKQWGQSEQLSDGPYYFLASFLIYSSVMAISNVFNFEWVFMADGVTCLASWLCLVRLYGEGQDYHMAFLLRKSIVMIGKLFLSFAPLFIGFSLLGYCLFCRYSGQFSSLWKTVMSIFYICYYNMTYESMTVTARSSFSMVFFVLLVLIFTMCIYSGMLVSVFCSYVWAKRQATIKKDILNSLKIQCSACNHQYAYTEGVDSGQREQENGSRSMTVKLKDRLQNCREQVYKIMAVNAEISRTKREDIKRQMKKCLTKAERQLNSIFSSMPL